MKHYSIETVTKNAEESWLKHSAGKFPDQLGKCAFMLGWLQKSYKNMYQDLPEDKKEKETTIDYSTN